MVKSRKDQREQDEIKLLHELVRNSKENLDTIAKRCRFSRQKTWRLMKELEKNKLIWGYSAIFDEQKIGLQHFILMLKRNPIGLTKNEKSRIIGREIEDVAKKYGMSIECSAFIHGEYDWMVTCLAPDIKNVKKFTDEMIQKYPGFLENLSIMQTLLFFTKNYILNPERAKLNDLL
ncbi:MAG TPA: Lrp/AsnC family transcriptional regulator [Candidatus Thermoplasmatota archaeon]|nr:Lrp/AsnC family transcriptional regulator [Candidatus Thermoplasmatota archaeon]